MTSSTPGPRRSVARQPGASSRRLAAEGDGPGRCREAVEGALLGLVLGERLNGAARAGVQGTVSASVLALAELAVTDDDPYDGEVARVIIEHGASNTRYGHELSQLFACWETGMPLGLAAFHVADAHGGGTSDLAATLMSPLALLWANEADVPDRARHLATIIAGDPAGVDAAGVLAAALAAAVDGHDPLIVARCSAATGELSRALLGLVTLIDHGVRPAALCEHLGTGPRGIDSIPMALFCAHRAPTFADAVGDALDATSGANAVPALTGALAGARFGAPAILEHLAERIHAATRRRIERVAAAVAKRGPQIRPRTDATLP